MVRIIAIDKDGNDIGKVRTVPLGNWENLQKFGKMLRWRRIESIIKKQKNEKRKRRESGDSV